jgi:Outer membrane protein beta-barrel domain
MQDTNILYKFYIHRLKIILTLCLIANVLLCEAQRTRWVQRNNPNYDDKKLTYGFLMALHTSNYQIDYADQFITQQFDTVHSVNPIWSSGFSLGFIVNYRLSEFLDLRLTPQVAFYEQRVRYEYTDETFTDATVESTMVEVPILLKYKSERRGNIRMYMIGGVKPAFEASGRKEQTKEELELKGTNISIEAGFGFDLYYPLFKFSPEIRFSRGVIDILGNTTNEFGQPLTRVNTNTVTVYFLFQ